MVVTSTAAGDDALRQADHILNQASILDPSYPPPVRRSLAPVVGLLVLTLACQKQATDTHPQPLGPAKSDATKDAEPPSPPTNPPADEAPKTLEAYLAATPAAPPVLPPELTGLRSKDPNVKVPRCMKTGWSYRDCDRVYPKQGRVWVRWECAHGENATSRSILCTRLAEYLLRGVGGPPNPQFARALFERQCHPDDPQFHHNCHVAARSLMFDDPTLALTYARRACDASDKSPIGCRTLLPTLEGGLSPRSLTLTTVEGLDGLAKDDACTLWTWPEDEGRCGARLACGSRVLYGEGGSSLPCAPDGTAGEDMTTTKDGDPAIRIDADVVELRDDETGRLGAFMLRGKLK